MVVYEDDVSPAGARFSQRLTALGERARQLRILSNLRQDELASRSGVGLMTVRRFEKSGRVSLENALRIAYALRADEAFEGLFELPQYASLDEALARPKQLTRQRVKRSPKSP